MNLANRVANRHLAKTLQLDHYGLEGLTTGAAVILYHGTTRLFKSFDLSKSRGDLVNKYYGAGIFLTPSKRVAEQYAEANRNIGFDPEVLSDLKRVNPGAGAFAAKLYSKGEAAWDELTPEALGVKPEDFSDAVAKQVGGLDPNTIADVVRLTLDSKLKSDVSIDNEPVNIFNTSTGLPDYAYSMLDELGVNSEKYRPKVYKVAVKVFNPLITNKKSEARGAKSKGYDCVIYYGSDLVGGVPEVAVFSPRNAKVLGYEVV